MKISTMVAMLATIGLVSTTPGIAQNDVQNENQQSGFGLSVGAKAFSLKNSSFSHNTHPDDAFLPNSNIPGSAGTTRLGGETYYATLGVNFAHPLPAISKSLSWRVEVGGLVGGQEDRHKNANDSRPDANAAFVYSDSTWGLYGSAGLVYHIGSHFYLGGDGEYNGVFISSGWDRFSSKESVKTDLVSIFTGGPVIGYDINKNFGVEAGAQLGNSKMFLFKIKYKF
jgi:hypothetical protein